MVKSHHSYLKLKLWDLVGEGILKSRAGNYWSTHVSHWNQWQLVLDLYRTHHMDGRCAIHVKTNLIEIPDIILNYCEYITSFQSNKSQLTHPGGL
jgi:hypothetical protein